MKRIIPLLAPMVLTLAVTLAFASPQRTGAPGRMPAPDRIAATLGKAGCPLSPEQMDRIKALEPGKTKPVGLREILTGDQEKALRSASRKGPDAKRLMRVMTNQLEKAGCPLTTEQAEKLNALKPGERNRKSVESILNPRQKEALLAAFRRHAEKRMTELSARLEKAGAPLTAEQNDQIRALIPRKNVFAALRNILTDTQKQALRESFRESRGPGGRNKFLHHHGE